MKVKSLPLLMLSLVLASCTKEKGFHVEKYEAEKLEDIPEDIKIPSKAWDLLEFKKTAEDHGGGGEHNAPADHPEPTRGVVFKEVTVYIAQKNEGVVSGEAVKIHLPNGGGTVDLSRYITDERGTFYVGFDFPSFENAKDKRVLFVSRTKKRKIGDQIFGAGCNQFFDISTKFFQDMKGAGIVVNTTQQRYLSVLGGTYLFSAQTEKEIHVAQVTFTHPKFANLFCEVH